MQPCLITLRVKEQFSTTDLQIGAYLQSFHSQLRSELINNGFNQFSFLQEMHPEIVERFNEKMTKFFKESKNIFKERNFGSLPLEVADFQIKVSNWEPDRLDVEVNIISETISVINTLPNRMVVIAVGDVSGSILNGTIIKDVHSISLDSLEVASISLVK